MITTRKPMRYYADTDAIEPNVSNCPWCGVRVVLLADIFTAERREVYNLPCGHGYFGQLTPEQIATALLTDPDVSHYEYVYLNP